MPISQILHCSWRLLNRHWTYILSASLIIFASYAVGTGIDYDKVSRFVTASNGNVYAIGLRVSPEDGIWEITTVDSTGTVGEYTSLAFNPITGYPAISYRDATNQDIKYARWNGSSWDVTPVDSSGDVGYWTSLAFDASGNPAIAYHKSVRCSGNIGDLKFASSNNGGTTWTITTVEAGYGPSDCSGGSWKDVGYYTSLVFDLDNNPAISYFGRYRSSLGSKSLSVKLARFNGTSWNITTVASISDEYYAWSFGLYTSLDFDRWGNIAISYYDRGDLAVSSLYGTSWTKTTVDSSGTTGLYTSLAFNPSDDNPSVSYYDSTNGNLMYARYNGASWETTPVATTGNVGLYTSLAFDPSGNPAISYLDSDNGDLKYAHYTGTSWKDVVVDSGGSVGYYTSLAFDSQGNPSISYYNASTGDLQFASFVPNVTTTTTTSTTTTTLPGAWQTMTIDYVGNVGLYTSLAFNQAGDAGISYYDATNGDLKYTHSHDSGATWGTTAVDSAGDVGEYTSLAFDASGNPAIAYHKSVRCSGNIGDLKFARSYDGGATWTETTIEAGYGPSDCSGGSWRDSGWYTSLTFDLENNPAITHFCREISSVSGYYLRVKLARSNGTSWDTTTVDSKSEPSQYYPSIEDNPGFYTSLAFDRWGDIAISYYTYSGGDKTLGVASLYGSSWTTIALGTTFEDDAGYYSSLDFNPSDNNPSISYYDKKDSNLMYARYNGASWETTPIATTGNVGLYTSLAFDGSGNPAISYLDADNGDLRYAHYTGTSWEDIVIDSGGNVGYYTSLAFDPQGYPAISYYNASTGDLKFARYVPVASQTCVAPHDINLSGYCATLGGTVEDNPVTPLDALIILGLSVGSITPDMLSPALTPAAAAIIGDGDGDGILEPVDALIALGVAVGSVPPQPPNPRCVPSSDISGACP